MIQLTGHQIISIHTEMMGHLYAGKQLTDFLAQQGIMQGSKLHNLLGSEYQSILDFPDTKVTLFV
jgi:hypothetical protein